MSARMNASGVPRNRPRGFPMVHPLSLRCLRPNSDLAAIARPESTDQSPARRQGRSLRPSPRSFRGSFARPSDLSFVALSSFFGPSLRPAFARPLRYYGLRGLLPRSHAEGLPRSGTWTFRPRRPALPDASFGDSWTSCFPAHWSPAPGLSICSCPCGRPWLAASFGRWPHGPRRY